MARKRKDSGLLEIALHGRWPVAASISGGALALAYIILPQILRGRAVGPICVAYSPYAMRPITLRKSDTYAGCRGRWRCDDVE
ncbi:hypothetical protein SAMN05660284_02527 [Formivibrio citricus]|uniref:Uncharacterized protein n=1 Tax=Formivibrio citricus TaxID=83765 RepID=A0A1I5CZH3_9NEIS|nr:hypothetical protein SAMN05660284_02527 [Formivibrio citricus]